MHAADCHPCCLILPRFLSYLIRNAIESRVSTWSCMSSLFDPTSSSSSRPEPGLKGEYYVPYCFMPYLMMELNPCRLRKRSHISDGGNDPFASRAKGLTGGCVPTVVLLAPCIHIQICTILARFNGAPFFETRTVLWRQDTQPREPCNQHEMAPNDPNMPSITLYQLNGTCANAAHALLPELSIPSTRIRMIRDDSGLFTSFDGSFEHDRYKQNVHHMGLVPALVVNGKTLTENPAVLTYIASLRPERKMAGANGWQRAKVLEWMAWLSGTLHGAGVGAFLRPYRFTDDEVAFPGIKKKALEKVLGCLDTIERGVEGKYAVGDGVTVVDFFLHVIWRWTGNMGVEREKFTRFREVAKNVERMEGVRRALIEEEMPLEFPEEEAVM